MLRLVTRGMLTGAIGFAWATIKTGERIVAYAENWEITEVNAERAGFVELAVWRVGRAVLRAGERLELAVDEFVMWLGYDDGEVTGVGAWT